MENNLISLKEYLNKKKTFVIPHYQRGYIWGKSRGSEKDSVQFLLESINNSFSNKNKVELFLQGVTVSEPETEACIELIDGQQRTTFFYLLLLYLGYEESINIKYSVRKESERFLIELSEKTFEEIINLSQEDAIEQFQDIFYFKKTLRSIDKEFSKADKRELLNFLLTNIKFLYINIPKEKAVSVFTMMNGNKAVMKTEEIIKAELLRLVSLEDNPNSPDIETIRWEQNLLRSKYAREWDKWTYWWNKPEVQSFYHTVNAMGLLVETYYSNKRKTKFNFDNFRDNFLRDKEKGNVWAAKNTFYELRQLQKKFEDVYNSIDDSKELHNKIGAILTIFGKENRVYFIREYFVSGSNINIDIYLKYAYLKLSHAQIMAKLTEKESNLFEKENVAKAVGMVEIAIKDMLDAITDALLYEHKEKHEYAYLQLLRLNVEADTALGRAFDFSIWEARSLEHIHAKSRAFELSGPNSNIESNEHCIGNLVLLYKNDNSKFGAKDFNQKKSIYFNLTKDKAFKSQRLLHTISVFSKERWGAEEIEDNNKKRIDEIKGYYEIQEA
jgi:hypothetical protein